MKRTLTSAITTATLGFVAVFTALTALPAAAHGWVTDPPSRQDNCATGATSFDCGSISYEPQSVEAPQGSLQCSGGNTEFSILDDDSKPWPVKDIDSSVTIQWKLTAAHNTSTWEYFVDGELHEVFDEGGKQPSSTISHTLTDLPAGEHTILARWNVSNTPNAFYNCLDVNVAGGDGGGTDGNTDPGDGTGSSDGTGDGTGTAPGSGTGGNTSPETCPAAYSATEVYLAGQQVTHNNEIWRAKWWTQGQAPGTTGEWGQWVKVGPCDSDGDGSDGDGSDGDGSDGDGSDGDGSDGDGSDGDGSDGDGSDGDGSDGDGSDGDGSDGSDGDGSDGGDPGDGDGDNETDRVVGYFTNWGVYQRNYHVKDIKTSGSAEKMTHILYAFGNVKNGECTIGDAFADFEKSYAAAQSVDGVADTWDQDLRGNFNQLRKLKAEYPHLKVIWSFGGWTWSDGFGQASQNPEAFASSCRDLVEDPRWADVFDGIDIDWEYPNACGATCDNSGYDAYTDVIRALRAEFGTDLVTSAITADATDGGKIDAADYAGAAEYLDWIMPMTYDFFGAWDASGPTAPHSPLSTYPGIPKPGFDSTTTVNKLTSMGIPSEKILLGLGFYGRGWTGVTQDAPGGAATGAAPGSYEAGIEDYKVLAQSCPATGTVGGTSYGFCNGNWWSYDTPQDIVKKMEFASAQDLGGAFFWELSGDTPDGDLVNAIYTGLQ
ncbi:glycosyl hydrolase family 18 protein [Jonesia quinghaiensis]|uniref:glycosyl hydrolase family 18 protein n=1 Tax=Jonesia quinghaiensis TaxID=262806 RepID=UPI0004287262|nr:glycosyl hydrolase family 18 protein [Jonesia quinghaiensis]